MTIAQAEQMIALQRTEIRRLRADKKRLQLDLVGMREQAARLRTRPVKRRLSGCPYCGRPRCREHDDLMALDPYYARPRKLVSA